MASSGFIDRCRRRQKCWFFVSLVGAVCLAAVGVSSRSAADEPAGTADSHAAPAPAQAGNLIDDGAAHFRQRVQPLLETYCYGCHGYGSAEGGRTLDEFASDEVMLTDVKLWSAVLKNVRAGIMPPAGEEQPTDEERAVIREWIKRDVFRIDPAHPDPGRVTLRRLNRVEYRNTIRDLMGVDFDTNEHFLPDDAGYGFDNIGDVLTISPLLLEKYLQAAETVVKQAIPSTSRQTPESPLYLRFFLKGAPPEDSAERDQYARELLSDFASKAYRRPVDDETIARLLLLAKGVYESPGESFETGVARAMVAVLASPRFLFRVEEPARAETSEPFPLIDEFALASRLSYFLWSTMPDDELFQAAGKNELRANLPAQVQRMLKDSRAKRLVENFVGQWLRSRDVQNVHLDPDAVVGIRDLYRAQRDQRRGHRRFKESTKRRIDELKRERREIEEQFEDSIENKKEAKGVEGDEAAAKEAKFLGAESLQAERQQRIDEIDKEIDTIHTERDAADDRHNEERDRVEKEVANLRAARDAFSGDLRRAMRRETEACFEHIMREDRSLLELIDADYTFLNDELAKYYGVPSVEGDEMRRVLLPNNSPRGGILTQGTLLVVTSNPTRTSPVKRGLHILDNVLGAPPPPPPPDIPALEQAAAQVAGHQPTNRELLEIHRREPLCHSCHARMDPLGLALENFNALGAWREREANQPIDATGELLTGEKFDNVRELKRILAEYHQDDFYRCLTEKLLTYALGRGLEYYDEHTVDQIVDRLESNDGKFSALLIGIIESAPFQRQRRATD